MKKRDLILVAIALLLAGGLYLIANLAGGQKAAAVVVTVQGEEKLRKPLAVSAEYEIRQEDGSVNIIAVENGAVYMKEANCRDGLCIHQGKMVNAAKTIVCLPHHLVITLDGEMPQGSPELDGLDVIVY